MLGPDLGYKLKQRRIEMGFSLRELARRTDLTASFLSQVENDKTSVSLESLTRIAESLEVPLFYFLSENISHEKIGNAQKQTPDEISEELIFENSPVIKPEHRPRLKLPATGVEYEKLVVGTGKKMEALLGRLAPGSGNIARRLREPTEEFIYVLSGKLLVGLDMGDYVLLPGHTIYFEGEKLQKLMCASEDEEATWISVITPAVF